VSSRCSRPNDGADGQTSLASARPRRRRFTNPVVLTATSRLKIEKAQFGRVRSRHLRMVPPDGQSSVLDEILGDAGVRREG